MSEEKTMKLSRMARQILLTGAALVMTGFLALPAAAVDEGSFERSLSVTGAVNLEITTGSGGIDIRSGSANRIQVTARIRASVNWFGDSGDVEARIKRIEANPPIQQSGNDVRIGHIDDPELRRNISISYEVIVPAETRLQAHTGSGSLQVEGIQGPVEAGTGSGGVQVSDISSAVRADTGSGNIKLDHIKGNVRAKAGSGSIHASDVAGGFEGYTGSGQVTLEQTAPGSVHVDTGSGGVELRGVRGSLEAKTGSGSIRAEGSPTGAWTLHTGSGGIRLKFPSDAAFDLYVHTGSGSLSVGPPVTEQGSQGHKEIRGKVHGGGVSVEAETGSGSIEIE
jgi:Putative adhesin